jgi:hypothetical protein
MMPREPPGKAVAVEESKPERSHEYYDPDERAAQTVFRRVGFGGSSHRKRE